jgi:hypothetical protein
MIVEFDNEEVTRILKFNGFHTLWHKDNWVPDDSENPDYAGRSKKDAFKQVLANKLGMTGLK